MTVSEIKKKLYEGDLKEGQYVIFQQFGTIDPKTDIPSISILITKIESVNIEKETVTLKDEEAPQPMYRIRFVVEGGETFTYPGYDANAIARDEGEMTDETYNVLKELENKDD